jgi:hypothetical protein
MKWISIDRVAVCPALGPALLVRETEVMPKRGSGAVPAERRSPSTAVEMARLPELEKRLEGSGRMKRPTNFQRAGINPEARPSEAGVGLADECSAPGGRTCRIETAKCTWT